MRSPPSTARSRTRGQHTATGPMPVTISRSGKCPWRTNCARPSAVSLSAWSPRKPATSASTACANSARAPLRKISVNGSLKVPGWASLITLSWVTAYHSFGGKVEAFEHPHDTPPPYPFIPSPTFAHSSYAHGYPPAPTSFYSVTSLPVDQSLHTCLSLAGLVQTILKSCLL